MKLDARTVAGLALPKGKSDVIYFDDELPGFGVRFCATGGRVRRSFVLQYRVHGRSRRIKIGGEALTLMQAREAAKKLRAKVELGGDPQADKAAERLKATGTLRAIVKNYLETKEPGLDRIGRPKGLRPSSYRVTELYLTGPAYFGPLQGISVNSISRADVAARVRLIERNSGVVTASRARAALSAFFSWAMREGLAEQNPVINTNAPAAPEPRDHVLTDAELVAVWRACEDDDHGRIVRLLALTGCRRQEVGGMRWSEMDEAGGTWTIPASRTKNGRQHILPLPPLAWKIIQSVPRMIERDCLFGERGERGFTAWSNGKAALDKRLGDMVAPWRVHDLRRSVCTRMIDLGVEPHHVEAVLNHYSGHRSGIAATYNRSKYVPQIKRALALWDDHIRALVEGTEPKIVALRSADA
jgi:integrase